MTIANVELTLKFIGRVHFRLGDETITLTRAEIIERLGFNTTDVNPIDQTLDLDNLEVLVPQSLNENGVAPRKPTPIAITVKAIKRGMHEAVLALEVCLGSYAKVTRIHRRFTEYMWQEERFIFTFVFDTGLTGQVCTKASVKTRYPSGNKTTANCFTEFDAFEIVQGEDRLYNFLKTEKAQYFADRFARAVREG